MESLEKVVKQKCKTYRLLNHYKFLIYVKLKIF